MKTKILQQTWTLIGVNSHCPNKATGCLMSEQPRILASWKVLNFENKNERALCGLFLV